MDYLDFYWYKLSWTLCIEKLIFFGSFLYIFLCGEPILSAISEFSNIFFVLSRYSTCLNQVVILFVVCLNFEIKKYFDSSKFYVQKINTFLQSTCFCNLPIFRDFLCTSVSSCSWSWLKQLIEIVDLLNDTYKGAYQTIK